MAIHLRGALPPPLKLPTQASRVWTPLRNVPRPVSIRHCSRWGLPCRFRRRNRGGLLPHRFTLAASGLNGAVCSLRRFPSGFPGRALPGTVVQWSPDFPHGRCPRGHPAIRAAFNVIPPSARGNPVFKEFRSCVPPAPDSSDASAYSASATPPSWRRPPHGNRSARSHASAMSRALSGPVSQGRNLSRNAETTLSIENGFPLPSATG